MIKNNQIYCSLTVITLWFLSLPFWIRNYIYSLNKVGQEKNCGTSLIYSMVYKNKNKTELVRYQHNNGEEFYWRGILLESGERPSWRGITVAQDEGTSEIYFFVYKHKISLELNPSPLFYYFLVLTVGSPVSIAWLCSVLDAGELDLLPKFKNFKPLCPDGFFWRKNQRSKIL